MHKAVRIQKRNKRERVIVTLADGSTVVAWVSRSNDGHKRLHVAGPTGSVVKVEREKPWDGKM